MSLPLGSEGHIVVEGKRSARLYTANFIFDKVADHQHKRLTVRHFRPKLDRGDILVGFCVIVGSIDAILIVYALQITSTDGSCCQQRAVFLPLCFKHGNAFQRDKTIQFLTVFVLWCFQARRNGKIIM